MNRDRIIVVGAGIGGLGAAYWLGKAGYEVEVFEASDRPGGRLMTLERDGDKVDVGAQFYHSNYTHCLELIEETGLSSKKRAIEGQTQYSLSDGSVYQFGHKIRYMRLLGLRGHLSFLAFLLRHVLLGKRFEMYRITRDIPEYDSRAVAEVVRDPKFMDYVVKPVCYGEGQTPPEGMSLYHFIHQLRLTILTNFVGLSTAVASLPEALAQRVNVRYGAPVRSLLYEGGKVIGVELESGSTHRAEHVIVAVTPDAAVRIVPDALDPQRQFFASFPHTPLPLPCFFLNRPLNAEIWNYFSDPSEQRDFEMAIDHTARVPEMVPSGKAIVSAWTAYPKSVELIEQPDDVVIKRAQNDLEFMIPGFGQWVEEATVVRHEWGVARYPPGQYGRIIDFRREAGKLRGVSFVGSAYGGTHMESSLVTAKQAVERISRGDHGAAVG
jgi:protoporphyrinogen oxidase